MAAHRFGKGNKAFKGRKHNRGGRSTREQTKLKAWTEKYCREFLQKHAEPIMKRYIDIAKSRRSAATTRHAIDKLIPTIEKVQHSGNVVYQTNLDKPKK